MRAPTRPPVFRVASPPDRRVWKRDLWILADVSEIIAQLEAKPHRQLSVAPDAARNLRDGWERIPWREQRAIKPSCVARCATYDVLRAG